MNIKEELQKMTDYSRELFESDLEMNSAEEYRRGYFSGRLHAFLELQTFFSQQEL